MATSNISKQKASNSAKPRNAKPIPTDVLARARPIAARYRLVIEWREDAGEYFGHTAELPGALGSGKTIAEAAESIIESAAAIVADAIDTGQRYPQPLSELTERTEQVNVRLTVAEKRELEERSTRGGFKGVSDYMRQTALG